MPRIKSSCSFGRYRSAKSLVLRHRDPLAHRTIRLTTAPTTSSYGCYWRRMTRRHAHHRPRAAASLARHTAAPAWPAAPSPPDEQITATAQRQQPSTSRTRQACRIRRDTRHEDGRRRNCGGKRIFGARAGPTGSTIVGGGPPRSLCLKLPLWGLSAYSPGWALRTAGT